jgi:hypothetical protein
VLTTAGEPGHWSRSVLNHALADPLWRVNEVSGPSHWLDPDRLEGERRRLRDFSYRRLSLNEWPAGRTSSPQRTTCTPASPWTDRSTRKRASATRSDLTSGWDATAPSPRSATPNRSWGPTGAASSLVYGIGKPLIEKGALPKGMRANADRFAGLDNTGSRVNVFNLARSVFRYVDRLNERPEVASKKTFVNVLVKARKPLTGARTRP